jgi:hypothetical protein
MIYNDNPFTLVHGRSIVAVDHPDRRSVNARALTPDLASGYVLREGDEVIDHDHGTVHRYGSRQARLGWLWLRLM